MSYQNFDELMHINVEEALRFARQASLAQEAESASPHGVRYALGHALVRLGRWLEGRHFDDDGKENADWRSNERCSAG